MYRFILLLALTLSSFMICPAQDNDPCTSEKGIILEGIGSMSASCLYLSYNTIDLINESLIYTTNIDYTGYLRVIEDLNRIIKDNIDKISKYSNISKDDSDFLKKMNPVFAKLLEDASTIKRYLASKDSNDYNTFKIKHSILKDEMQSLFGTDKE